jgi:Methyltransferase domain
MIQRDTEMSAGEQAALEGILSMISPRISVEIGTYTGGSLKRISQHSDHVHTFDLASHVTEHLPNVDYHLGDSATSVSQVLTDLEREGLSVDFVLIDGDHSRTGVYRDARNILDSKTTRDAVLLFHDIANEAVRSAVREAIRGRQLAYVDLSFTVPARVSSLLGEAWGGFGLVVVGGPLWPHTPDVRPNVTWRTTTRRGRLWRALSPVRSFKRAGAYRLRPLVRRWRGVRGVRA